MAIPLDKRSNLSEFRSLSNNYVFYERLKDEEGKEKLYSSIKASIGKASEIVLNLSQQYEKLFEMSNNELRKEERLLNEIFGANINIDLSNRDSVKELIDTFNNCLSLKKAYEDNIQLVKNTKGAKSAISFFPTYFNSVWKDKQSDIYKEIEKINLDASQQEVNEQFLKLFEDKLQEIIKEAIIKMFKAEPTLKEEHLKGEGSYSELLKVIGDFRNKGSFANQIYNIYNLKEIQDILSKQISQQQKINNFSTEGIVSKDFNQRGGLALESLENLVLNEIGKKLKKLKNIKTEVIHSGSKNVKADNIMTFNLQMGKVQEILDTLTVSSGREKNIEAFNNLGEQLSKIDNGYIVYSSDKNYTYNENFECRGGFGGESINLETYESIVKQIDKNFNGFVGAIAQTLKGAIGENMKESLEETIAQQVAFLLFDDFKTIGVQSGNAIHIFNLNGIYIPLSFLLFLLGTAIKDGLEDPKKIVRVDLRVPQIQWPEKSRPHDAGIEAWKKQRALALKNTQINMHFLSNFKSLITEYL